MMKKGGPNFQSTYQRILEKDIESRAEDAIYKKADFKEDFVKII